MKCVRQVSLTLNLGRVTEQLIQGITRDATGQSTPYSVH